MGMMMMTTRLLVLYMVLAMALMCLVLVISLKPDHVSSDCSVEYGCIPTTETSSSSSTETSLSSSTTEIRSRKLLLHSNAEEVFKSFVPILIDQHHQQQLGGGHESRNIDGYRSSLRNAPSGPDPLHHNGSGPKKPEDP